MGFGVLEDHTLAHVPGTAALEDLDELNVARRNTSGNVKYSAGGIILVPQPSDDPNGMITTLTAARLTRQIR